jgi:hypothetical protein
MVELDVADHGLNGSSSSHLAAEGFGDPANLAGDPNLEPVGVIVATVSLVDMDAFGSGTG